MDAGRRVPGGRFLAKPGQRELVDEPRPHTTPNHCLASALAPQGRGRCVAGASGVAAVTGGADERGTRYTSRIPAENVV